MRWFGAVMCGILTLPGVADARPAEGRAVVLELFTSQGCSSCPPADRLFSEIGASGPYADRVLPLAFHVDYWNHIGWKDPFSTDRWSRRQQRYARALPSGVYTPQIVFNGRAHAVGSKRGVVQARLKHESKLEPVAFDIETKVMAHAVAVHVQGELPPGQKLEGLELVVVLYENGLTTHVTRGENDGRTLKNDFIVRSLVTTKARIAEAGLRAGATVEIPRAAQVNVDHAGIAAFWQRTADLRIFGGGRVDLRTTAK